jgi:purine catabolism regulator
VSALRAGIPTSHVRQTWDRPRPFRFRAGHEVRVVAAAPIESQAPSGDGLLEQAHRRVPSPTISRE